MKRIVPLFFAAALFLFALPWTAPPAGAHGAPCFLSIVDTAQAADVASPVEAPDVAPAEATAPPAPAAPLYMTGTFWTLLLAALLAVSELLSLSPSIKANGIFQAVTGILGKLAGRRA